MKKSLLSLIVCLLVFPLMAVSLDSESASMGNMKAALNPDIVCDYHNPAILAFFDQSYKVLATAEATTAIPASFPYFKESNASVMVVGKNMLIDMDLAWWPKYNADTNLYDLMHYLSIKTLLSYRFKDFGFGLGFTGGSEKQRTDIKLEDSFFSGIVSESLFGRYSKTPQNTESVELSAGFAYCNSGFTFGIVCENIFMTSSESKFQVSLMSVADSMDMGIYYSMDKYNKMGRLNKNVLSGGFEFQRIWSETEKSFNAGFKYMYQFNRNINAFVELGTDIKMADVVGRSLQTFGLGAQFNHFRLTLSSAVPFNVYTKNKDRTEISVLADFIL